MIIAEKTTANRLYYVREGRKYGDASTWFFVEYRPLNPKTGTPWQASHIVAEFSGDRARAKALFAWCKAAK